MSLTKFPQGIQTSHVVSAETTKSSGKVFFVCNSTTVRPGGVVGADVAGLGLDPNRPFSTVDFAVGQCVANRGDTIFVMEGHAESYTAAGSLAIDVAGVSIIGLGVGNNRPRFTFSSTDNAATVTQSANNTKFLNCILICNDDGLTNALVVSGDNCEVDVETQDTSSAIEAETFIRIDTANNCIVRAKHLGFTAGNAMVRYIAVDDCDNARIEIDSYGVVSTAWVNMVDVASTNVRVTGTMYTQGITDGSRTVVDTITGSTWSAEFFDASSGQKISGGSAAALAGDDISAIASDLLVPGADATTNSKSRDVVGNKTDLSVYDVGTTKSLMAYLKGLVDAKIIATGTFTTSSTTAPADTSRAEVTGYFNGCILLPLSGGSGNQPRRITNFNNTGGVFTIDAEMPFTTATGTQPYIIIADVESIVPAADATSNTMPAHVIGNKTDAAVTTVATTKSIIGYAKGLVNTLLSGAAADGAGNSSLVDVVGNKTDASIYTPGTTKSLAAYAKGTSDLQERVAKKAAATIVNGQTLFTVAGGPIEIYGLVSLCVTGNDATASTIQYNITPTTGAAQTISGASASVANATAGASITLAGTALSTAALYNNNGPNLIANPGTIFCPIGTVTAVVAVGSTTGTWEHYLRYKPLATGVTVS